MEKLETKDIFQTIPQKVFGHPKDYSLYSSQNFGRDSLIMV